MGMFNYIKIDRKQLPVEIPDDLGHGWQTKDTPHQYLRVYQITPEGELHLLEWNGEAYVFEEALDDFHGDIAFYDSASDEWFEFVARFTEGKLTRIWRVENDDLD